MAFLCRSRRMKGTSYLPIPSRPKSIHLQETFHEWHLRIKAEDVYKKATKVEVLTRRGWRPKGPSTKMKGVIKGRIVFSDKVLTFLFKPPDPEEKFNYPPNYLL